MLVTYLASMFSSLGDILTSPLLIVLMFGSTLLGIFFGSLAGLDSNSWSCFAMIPSRMG